MAHDVSALLGRPPRVLLAQPLPDPVTALLARQFEITAHEDGVPFGSDRLREAMTRFDAICSSMVDHYDAALLATPEIAVRILANFGTGVDHIDLAAARRAGIVVTNTPDAVTEATAEIATLLMLNAARRAAEGERLLRAGGWSGWRPNLLIGQTLVGRTLGVIGFGRIAQATARRAAGLGMHILYHARRRADVAIEASLGAVHVASLDDLLARADVVSVHIPGGAETRHLVDAAGIARMQPHAILINTARGSVVDEAALADALAAGRIAAAGLDVYEREPEIHPRLLACENAVLLPHMGTSTLDARMAMGRQVADNLAAFFRGAEPPHRLV